MLGNGRRLHLVTSSIRFPQLWWKVNPKGQLPLAIQRILLSSHLTMWSIPELLSLAWKRQRSFPGHASWTTGPRATLRARKPREARRQLQTLHDSCRREGKQTHISCWRLCCRPGSVVPGRTYWIHVCKSTLYSAILFSGLALYKLVQIPNIAGYMRKKDILLTLKKPIHWSYSSWLKPIHWPTHVLTSKNIILINNNNASTSQTFTRTLGCFIQGRAARQLWLTVLHSCVEDHGICK